MYKRTEANVKADVKRGATRRETLRRHALMDCKTFNCKINKQALSKKLLKIIDDTFLESKWYTNWVISQIRDIKLEKLNDIDRTIKRLNKIDTKTKTITHKDYQFKDHFVTLEHFGSQPRQSTITRMKGNLKTLKELWRQGKQKPGQLKFKTESNIIDYKQHGNSYTIMGHNKVKLLDLGIICVNGLKQFINIPGIELGNARLIRKGNDLILQVITYTPKSGVKWEYDDIIGIDMGCTDNIVTSKGDKYSALIKETERINGLRKKMRRQIKGSKNYRATSRKLKQAYRKLDNQKNEAANKIVHELLKHRLIIMQDEQLHEWHKGGHGKAIQHSVLGRVKRKLLEHAFVTDEKELERLPEINNDKQVVVLPDCWPTTKLCTNCGAYHDELKESDRTFKCSCGVVEDRDIHAACNMIWLFKNIAKCKVGQELARYSRVEMESCVRDSIVEAGATVMVKPHVRGCAASIEAPTL